MRYSWDTPGSPISSAASATRSRRPRRSAGRVGSPACAAGPSASRAGGCSGPTAVPSSARLLARYTIAAGPPKPTRCCPAPCAWPPPLGPSPTICQESTSSPSRSRAIGPRSCVSTATRATSFYGTSTPVLCRIRSRFASRSLTLSSSITLCRCRFNRRCGSTSVPSTRRQATTKAASSASSATSHDGTCRRSSLLIGRRRGSTFPMPIGSEVLSRASWRRRCRPRRSRRADCSSPAVVEAVRQAFLRGERPWTHPWILTITELWHRRVLLA